jgi:hypothetical protein
MPLPVYTDVHVDAALTEISVAYIQKAENYIADKVFPMVPVVHRSDVYFVFSKSDFLRDEVRPVADTEETAGGGFALTTQSYAATVWGYHKDVGDQTRGNQDPAIDIDMTTTKFIMQKQLIRRDALFASNYMKTTVWGTDITGVASAPSNVQTIYWSDDANSDPFTDIANGQTTILQNTGFEPNVLVLSYPVYQALRKHPLVIDRVKYTMQADAKNITPQLLAAAFDIEEVLVSKAVYTTSLSGTATPVYSFIVGKHALLAYRNPAPGLMMPSAGYIFPWEGLTGMNSMGVVVWQERLPGRGRNTIRTDSNMAFDMQIVSKDLGYFFSGIVA